MVQAFTHGPVKLEAQKDGKFELFGGNICGVFVELVRMGSDLHGMRHKIQSFGTKEVGSGADISHHIMEVPSLNLSRETEQPVSFFFLVHSFPESFHANFGVVPLYLKLGHNFVLRPFQLVIH